MAEPIWRRLQTFDPFLFLLPLALVAVSIIFMYVLTIDYAGGSLAPRQSLFAGIGLIGMLVATFIDYRAWKAWRWWFFGASAVLLALVPFVGVEVFGARSWISLGGFQFQPSEVVKLSCIVVLAGTLQVEGRPLSVRRFLLSAALVIVPIILILLQPDFGTALIFAAVGVSMLLHANLQRWQRWLVLAVLAVAVGAVILAFKDVGPFGDLLADYQKNRLASFLDPARDPQGSGYNVLQSKIAVGSGGLLGQGLGYGSQSQLNFLPVVHTDFIFAAIAEAWGLLGAAGLLAGFAWLVYRLLAAGRQAQDDFGYFLTIGLATMIIFQVMVNVGMNVGVMPVTGIPLPFVSYGGTALIIMLVAIGLVQAVVLRSKRLTF